MTEDTFTPPKGLGFIRQPFTKANRILYGADDISAAALPDNAKHMRNIETVPWAGVHAFDQGPIGTCTGTAYAGVMHNIYYRDGHLRPSIVSPVVAYGQARKLINEWKYDSGAIVRDVWKAGQKFGNVPMSLVPMRFTQADLPDPQTYEFPETSIWRKEPTKGQVADAEQRQVLEYLFCPTLTHILRSLAEGYCVQFGIELFRSFYSDNGTPLFVTPMPTERDRDIGGHSMYFFDYDIPSRYLMAMQSWGDGAHEGHNFCMIPFDYYLREGSDAVTGRKVEGFGQRKRVLPVL